MLVSILSSIISIFALSLAIYISLILFGKSNWIKTQTQITTFFLLPIITFVIVKVISGNISLSIGMVGALSIVRFRNPVRSPLELAIYFLMITLGIAISVDITWGYLLTLSTIIVYLLLYIFDKVYKKIFLKSFFSYSHGEMNDYVNIMVESSIEINDFNQHLISISSYLDKDNKKIFSYNFNIIDKKNSLVIFNELQNREGIKNIHLQV